MHGNFDDDEIYRLHFVGEDFMELYAQIPKILAYI